MYSHLFTSPFTCHSQLSAWLASATSELAEQLMANALKHQLEFCKRKRRTNPKANKQMGGRKAKEVERGVQQKRRGCREEEVQIDNVPSVLL